MVDEYTRLLEAVAELDDKTAADTAVSKLILHLKSSGRMKMLPQIMRELRKVAARRDAHKPVVEVASDRESARALESAAQEGITAPKAQINPSLIRGWRARSGDKLVDRSAKGALISIYQKVTS
jgi:F0F1-type ATP synthase delta subunit